MIDSDHKLKNLLPVLREADWVALDTEADSLHSYPEKLCLLQISLPGKDELVDPLSGIDLPALLEVLRHHRLILHGADYDLRLLRRGYGFVPKAIFDTMLAARLLGLREFGLHHLAAKYLGQQLEKGPQKANWGKRPLTERMITYALNDTRMLKPLADLLRAELEQKGRLAWHQECCDRLVRDCARLRPRDPDQIWRIAGSERLSRRALAVLKELWHWREKEALSAGKPPYYILSHELIIKIAESTSLQALDSLLPPHWSIHRRASFKEAVVRGTKVPIAQQPRHMFAVNHHVSAAAKQRYERLRQHRDRMADELGLEASFIASRATLLALARDHEEQPLELMQWQRQLLIT